MSIKPGTYKAKIIDYGYFQKEGKNPSVMVQFQFVEQIPNPAFPTTPDEEIRKLTWFGSFNGGARPITIKTLVETLGFNGTDGTELLQGIGSNVLREDREYDLVIEPNTYNGQTRDIIKYINLPGVTRQVEKLDQGTGKIVIGGLNLAGDILAAKQKVNDSDIPF
jgi:hypothetical protein